MAKHNQPPPAATVSAADYDPAQYYNDDAAAALLQEQLKAERAAAQQGAPAGAISEGELALRAVFAGKHPMAALAAVHEGALPGLPAEGAAPPRSSGPPPLQSEKQPRAAAQPPPLEVSAQSPPPAPTAPAAPRAAAEEPDEAGPEQRRAEATREQVIERLRRDGLSWDDGMAIIEAVVEGNRPYIYHVEYRAGRWISFSTRTRSAMANLPVPGNSQFDAVFHRALTLSLMRFGDTDLSTWTPQQRSAWLMERQELTFYMLATRLSQFDDLTSYLLRPEVLRLF